MMKFIFFWMFIPCIVFAQQNGSNKPSRLSIKNDGTLALKDKSKDADRFTNVMISYNPAWLNHRWSTVSLPKNGRIAKGQDTSTQLSFPAILSMDLESVFDRDKDQLSVVELNAIGELPGPSTLGDWGALIGRLQVSTIGDANDKLRVKFFFGGRYRAHLLSANRTITSGFLPKYTGSLYYYDPSSETFPRMGHSFERFSGYLGFGRQLKVIGAAGKLDLDVGVALEGGRVKHRLNPFDSSGSSEVRDRLWETKMLGETPTQFEGDSFGGSLITKLSGAVWKVIRNKKGQSKVAIGIFTDISLDAYRNAAGLTHRTYDAKGFVGVGAKTQLMELVLGVRGSHFSDSYSTEAGKYRLSINRALPHVKLKWTFGAESNLPNRFKRKRKQRPPLIDYFKPVPKKKKKVQSEENQVETGRKQ